MHYEFFWAFRLSPSGFPLYLCSPCFRLAPKIPLSVVCCPLSVVTKLAKDAAPIPNALEATESRI